MEEAPTRRSRPRTATQPTPAPLAGGGIVDVPVAKPETQPIPVASRRAGGFGWERHPVADRLADIREEA